MEHGHFPITERNLLAGEVLYVFFGELKAKLHCSVSCAAKQAGHNIQTSWKVVTQNDCG